MTLLSNSATGTHAGAVTRTASVALSQRHLLVKNHTSAGQVALNGSNDIPLGIAVDEADTAGDPVAVALLGATGSSLLGVASASVAAGDYLIPAAAGKVVKRPSSTGTYNVIGRALHGASANDLVEFDPCLPTPHRL